MEHQIKRTKPRHPKSILDEPTIETSKDMDIESFLGGSDFYLAIVLFLALSAPYIYLCFAHPKIMLCYYVLVLLISIVFLAFDNVF